MEKGRHSGMNITTTLPEYMSTFHKEDGTPEQLSGAKPGKFFTVEDNKIVNYNLGTFKYGEHFTKVFAEKFSEKFTWS